ncbi:hypothetical protein ACFL2M_01870 [Patescibacteria group bacterium]
MKRYLPTILVAALFLVLPYAAQAELIPACATGEGHCSGCDMIALFANWAEVILQMISGVAVFMIVFGGVWWIISGGNPEKVKKGQQIIIGAVIGVILVLTGWLIVNFSIQAMLGTQGGSIDEALTGEAQLFGSNWDTFCENVSATSAGTALADCSAGEAVDGEACQNSSQCNDYQSCVCSGSSCVPSCEYNASLDSTINAGCVDSLADCTALATDAIASYEDISLGGCPGDQVCCRAVEK